MSQARGNQLPRLAGRYVEAWCLLLTRSASDTQKQSNAEALHSLLLALGRLFVAGLDPAPLTTSVAVPKHAQRASRLAPNGKSFLTESSSRLRSTPSGEDQDTPNAEQQLLAIGWQLSDAAATSTDPATALRSALHASGQFPLLAEHLLTGGQTVQLHAERTGV